MNLPNPEDIREMKSLRILVKYALQADLKDHELWEIFMRLKEYGEKVTEKGWQDKDIKRGPLLDDMKILTEKVMRMLFIGVGLEYPEDLSMGLKHKFPE